MKVIAYILMLVGFINIVSFMIFTIAKGGDAVNGKIEDGRYYLGNHSHYTEVSASVFQFSRFQTHSVWITQPLMFVGAFILYRKQKKGVHAA